MVRPYQMNNLLFEMDDDQEYVASTGYAQLRAKGSNTFLYQLIHTAPFTNSVLEKCTGSNYPAISSSDLANVRTCVPSLPEQQKIADCLSSLDDLIRAEASRLEALQAHKKGPPPALPRILQCGAVGSEAIGKAGQNGRATYETTDLRISSQRAIPNHRPIAQRHLRVD